jgi:hypothetical protein
MRKPIKQELLETRIGQRSLREWQALWEPLPRPFSQDHADLRGVIGLLRIKLSNDIKYFVRATETKGGIAKGLRRLSGPSQTGNRNFGAQKIRENLDVVTVDVLKMTGESDPATVAKRLKIALNNLHDPEWSWAHKRRMQNIREGKLNLSQ